MPHVGHVPFECKYGHSLGQRRPEFYVSIVEKVMSAVYDGNLSQILFGDYLV